MYFVGVDLAWSERNYSAISIIKGKCKKGEFFEHISKIRTNEEIVDWIIDKTKGKESVIAIDAPLIVKNLKGRRKADALVTKLFRKYDAGAHPTNIERLKKYGGLRTIELVKLFEKEGYIHNPYFKPKSKVKAIIEVFPHPAIVVLFGLNKILKYKTKKGRKKEDIIKEFERYRKGLLSLSKKEPSLKIPKNIFKDVSNLKGKTLKEYEDLLDSIICAYTAFYYWYWGSEKCAILGNLDEGYIVTPIFGYMKSFLKIKQKTLLTKF